MSYYRKRLYLCQVDSIEGKNSENLAQRAFFVGQGEYEARLVSLVEGA